MSDWTPVSSVADKVHLLQKDVETIRRALVDAEPGPGSVELVVAGLLRALLIDISTLHQAVENVRHHIDHETALASRAARDSSEKLERLTRDLQTWRERATERAQRIADLQVEYRQVRDLLRELNFTPPQLRSRPGRQITALLRTYAGDCDVDG